MKGQHFPLFHVVIEYFDFTPLLQPKSQLVQLTMSEFVFWMTVPVCFSFFKFLIIRFNLFFNVFVSDVWSL